MGRDPVRQLSRHSVYGQVGRRKLGHDPHRHGRFTTIVDRRENGFNRAELTDALFAIPINQLISTRYDDVHTHLALF